MDINAEAEVNNASQDQSIRIANGMVESVAELLGQQSAEIVAHVNRWSEELIRNITTPSLPMIVRQMCPLCGCIAFAWRQERAALCCVQCASTGQSRLMSLLIERSGLLKRGVCVLDLTPAPALALRSQALASEYRRPGPLEGAEPANIDCTELCAAPPPARLRARFDLLIHTHPVQPGPGTIGPALQNLSACLKDTGHMLFTVPIRVAPGAAEGRAAESAQGFDGNELQHLLRRQFGNRLSIVDPLDYLAPQDFEFYRIPVGSGLSSDTLFAVAGS